MRPRIATGLAVLGLVVGGGGAVAMAESGASGGSAALAQYGCHDQRPDKCEKTGLVHHCKKINWRSQNCKTERREIRHCERKRSKDHCLKVAGPIGR